MATNFDVGLQWHTATTSPCFKLTLTLEPNTPNVIKHGPNIDKRVLLQMLIDLI